MIGNDCDNKLSVIWNSEGFHKVMSIIDHEYDTKTIYPPKEDIFAALKNTPFKDVKAGEWYSDYIAAAYENGAVIGLSEDNFGVGEYVTREQLAVIIYRILLRKGIVFKKDETSLSDVESISDYAKEAVLAMEASSIIMGYDDGSFKPFLEASRAAAAAIIYRAINVAEVTA